MKTVSVAPVAKIAEGVSMPKKKAPEPDPEYIRLAKTMLGTDVLPRCVRARLNRAAAFVACAGGRLRSRQAIAAILMYPYDAQEIRIKPPRQNTQPKRTSKPVSKKRLPRRSGNWEYERMNAILED